MRLLTDELDRESHRRDETAYLPTGLPLAVALPTTTDEVATLVRLCAEHGVPIVPRGAGTGLSGGAAGIEGALTIAFTRMNRILEIDRENLTVTAQPGVINAALKSAVAAEGLFYPPDPASYEQCTIGGNLGTNAGGLCCVKYGVTRDSVLGLEVVLADATVLRLGGKNVKDVAGYGLIPLLVGSQGTLGLITEATLRLRPAPPPRSTMLAFFATLEAAGEAVAGIPGAGASPVTLELMDAVTIAAVDELHRLGLDREAAAMLLIESDLPGVAAEFSGILCVDEVYQGKLALLLAVDPAAPEGDPARAGGETREEGALQALEVAEELQGATAGAERGERRGAERLDGHRAEPVEDEGPVALGGREYLDDVRPGGAHDGEPVLGDPLGVLDAVDLDADGLGRALRRRDGRHREHGEEGGEEEAGAHRPIPPPPGARRYRGDPRRTLRRSAGRPPAREPVRRSRRGSRPPLPRTRRRNRSPSASRCAVPRAPPNSRDRCRPGH